MTGLVPSPRNVENLHRGPPISYWYFKLATGIITLRIIILPAVLDRDIREFNLLRMEWELGE